MKKILLIIVVLWSGCLYAQTDSVKYFTQGDITSKTFQVEEILVHSDCECVGACTCEKWQQQRPQERFGSVEEILARSGRIALIRRGNYAFEPVLNGMTTERTNLTIDGMKVFGACVGKMDPVTSYVEPNNLEQFDVENGAGGSEYGTSMGGSVNMETRGARIGAPEKWSGNAGLGFDAVSNGLNGLVSLNRSSDNWAVNLNSTYRKSGNYRAGGGARVSHSQFEKWNTALSAKFMPSKRDLIRIDYIYDDANDIGYPGLPMDVEYATAHILGLSYTRYPGNGIFSKLTFKGYVNGVNHNMNNYERPEAPMLMDMPGTTRTYGGFVRGEIRAGKHAITAKADGFFNNSFADMIMYPADAQKMYMVSWPDVNKTNLGLYLQDDYRLDEKNLFIVKGRIEFLSNLAQSGMGIDQAKIIGQDISPRDNRFTKAVTAGYQRDFNDRISAWINTGYTERAPNVNEQYAFYIYNAYDGYNYIGNYDLKNENALQTETGLSFREEKFGIRATAFWYYMTDYILSKIDPNLPAMTTGANGVKVTDNIPEATMLGGTVGGFFRPVKSVEINTDFAFTRGETGKGIPLPLISPLRNTTSMRYHFAEKANVALEAESALAQDRINPEFGEVSSEGYTIFHLRCGYDLSIGGNKLTANAGIENIFDTRYRDHLDWGTIDRPGRNIYIDLKYRF